MASFSDLPLVPGPLVAKLGSVVRPNLFWAVEIPCLAPSAFQKTSFHQLRALEYVMSKVFNKQGVKIEPEGRIKDKVLREGMLVRSRRNMVNYYETVLTFNLTRVLRHHLYAHVDINIHYTILNKRPTSDRCPQPFLKMAGQMRGVSPDIEGFFLKTKMYNIVQ